MRLKELNKIKKGVNNSFIDLKLFKNCTIESAKTNKKMFYRFVSMNVLEKVKNSKNKKYIHFFINFNHPKVNDKNHCRKKI
jgi:hypothetical protein